MKSVTHVNLILRDASTGQASSADRVIDWLAEMQMPLTPSDAIAAHHAALDRRRNGGWSIPEIAERTGDLEHELRNLRGLDRYLAFCSFKAGESTFSVDVLNAANELGLEEALSGREAVELFVRGPERPHADQLWDLTKMAVARGDIAFAFGGDKAFTGRLAFGLMKKQAEFKYGRRVEDFLWPVHYSKHLPHPEALPTASVYRWEELDGGYLIQMWENVVNGQHLAYREAAHTLGLGCLWDLHAPRGVERIPLRLRALAAGPENADQT